MILLVALALGPGAKAAGPSIPVPHITSLTASPDGRLLASASSRGWLSIWDLHQGRPAYVFKAHDDDILVLRFSPRGKFLLSGSDDQTAKLWSVPDFRNVRTFKTTGNVTGGAVFSDGSGIILGFWNGKLGLWDVASGQQKASAEGHLFGRVAVDISPSGKWAVTGGSDQTIRLWDTRTLRQVRYLKSGERGIKAHLGIVHRARFLDNERVLSLANSGMANSKFLRLWNARQGYILQSLEGAGRAAGMSFSRDRKRALFANRNEGYWQAVVFDLVKWQPTRILNPVDGVVATALTPNGRIAVTGSLMGRISFWNANTGEYLAAAWTRFNNDWGVEAPDGRLDKGKTEGPRVLAELLKQYLDGPPK